MSTSSNPTNPTYSEALQDSGNPAEFENVKNIATPLQSNIPASEQHDPRRTHSVSQSRNVTPHHDETPRNVAQDQEQTPRTRHATHQTRATRATHIAHQTRASHTLHTTRTLHTTHPNHATHPSHDFHIPLSHPSHAENATIEDTHAMALSHNRLAYQSHVILRLGTLLLGAGASAYRTKVAMQRLGHAVGVDAVHVCQTYTTISITCYAGGTYRTMIAEQRTMGTNSARIDALNRFVLNLPSAILVEDANATLDAILATPPLYKRWMLLLATGLACSGFCFLNHGGLVECATVFFASMIGQFLRQQLTAWHCNSVGAWFISGVVSSSAYLGIVLGYGALTHEVTLHQAGVVSSLLFLIPGFPLVTALLDTIRGDLTCGIIRFNYAFILMASAGMAVWLPTWIFHAHIAPVDGYSITEPWLFVARCLATFVASSGFAMLFSAPLSAALLAGLNGAIINSTRLTLQDAGLYNVIACVLAATCVGIIAFVFSHFSKHSRVSLSVPSVVVMIPGTMFFRALAAINAHDTVAAIDPLFNCFLVIVAIGAGLAVSRMLTDRNWLIETPSTVVPTFGDSRSTLTPDVIEHVEHANSEKE
ncbi:threonine/serine ThrE exporter family protein [Actinotignum urinale]|uniref:threonine/serine ThrE exporter family protein n=1 Tax=Actinotignum urinale TaxID=190146 RepID=UPI00280B2033|nr:threonine/serine exporter family protein [Actinotignum urinale]